MNTKYYSLKDITSNLRDQSQEARTLVEKAWHFGKEAHEGQTRLSGEPYFESHVATTAYYLASIGMDASSVAAGLLHDILEDTKITKDDIEGEFGKDVAFIVEGVTKLGKLKYRGLERHVESTRKLLVATAQDIRVIIVKMYDRLHNMETNQFHDAERQKRKALETMEVYVPIAERLGMSVVKTQLEDLCFKTLEPERYEETKKLLAERRSELEERLIDEVKELKKELGKNNVRNFRTETRVKGVYSFARKIEKKEGDISSIYDILALRVIVKNVEECYRVLGIVHAVWRPIPGRIKDYIAFPKPNGYQSIHTSILTHHGITVEVQIRTEQMHREGQYGVASHFSYSTQQESAISPLEWIRRLLPNLMKTGTSANSTPRWVQDLTEAQSELAETDTLNRALKEDFFAERMFVFTPKGDVIDLPVGATSVDFAYSIHSSIGDTMSGARINGRMVALETPLKNGDVVEIITKKNGTPNKKWISFAKTANARKHIRSALHKIEESK